MKKILISWYSDQAWQGDIVAYQNIHTNKIITKEQYNELIEREIMDLWHVMDDEEKKEFNNFEHFRENMLNNPDHDYIPLVEIVVSEDEDLEQYEPYIEL